MLFAPKTKKFHANFKNCSKQKTRNLVNFFFNSVEQLPFGGVGARGMGSYHGKAGFDTFTHYKVNIFPSYDRSVVNHNPLS